jgi:hypothetical protein
MIFSEHQLKLTYNFISQADETNIQAVLAGIKTDQLKKLLKTVERYIRNRDPLSECLCSMCHRHAVNVEDGIEVCDSCLAE